MKLTRISAFLLASLILASCASAGNDGTVSDTAAADTDAVIETE